MSLLGGGNSLLATRMFPPGTQVVTESGAVDVRRLHGNERLQVCLPSGKAGFRAIKRVYMGSAPGKLFCLQTSTGRRFCATPDQPLPYGLQVTRLFHDLMLVKREGLGFFLVVANGLFRDNVETRILFKRQEPQSKESVWLLSANLSANQANYEQALLSCQYGIPMFPTGTRKGERTMPEELFRRLLIEVNTFARARRLLADRHLDEELPHWLMRALPEAELPHRQLLDVVYFGGDDARHAVNRHPLGESLRITGEKLRNLMTRQVRLESLPNRQEVAERIEAARKDPFADVQERVRLGLAKPYFLMPLAYARPGMVCVAWTPDGLREDPIEQALLERYEGPVYGIDLEGDEPLVAGGLVMGLARPAGHRAPEPTVEIRLEGSADADTGGPGRSAP
ncbi:MAG: hypothetical protein HY303_17325 [Candidatus Wallbacteria bacterium]|nr:hypothetical protein [Candidatus Wallbacteria bacterium]